MTHESHGGIVASDAGMLHSHPPATACMLSADSWIVPPGSLVQVEVVGVEGELPPPFPPGVG